MFKVSGPTASIAVVAALVLSGIGAGPPVGSTARADDCAGAPQGAAPAGQHWYYHLDPANHRKCWHLRATVPLPHDATAQTPAAATEPAHTDPAPQPAAAEPPSSSNADGVQPSERDANAAQPAPHITVLTVKTVPAPFVDATTESQQRALENINASPMPQTLPYEDNKAAVKPTESAGTAPLQTAPDVAHHEPARTIDTASAATRKRSGEMFLLLALALGIAAIFIAIVSKIAGPYRAPGFADHPDAAWINYRTGHQRIDDEGPYDEVPDQERDVPFIDAEPQQGLADLDGQPWTDQSSPGEARFSPARSQNADPARPAPPSVEDIELALRILRQARQSRVV